MNQGYGQQPDSQPQNGPSQDGQQQWGQDPFGQQQGQDQQWGQASPAPAYGSPAQAPAFSSPAPASGPGAAGSVPGYPGAAGGAATAGGATGGASPSGLQKLTKWMLILAIAAVVVRLVMGIIGFATGLAIGATDPTSDAAGVALIGGGLAALAMLLLNGVVSLALLVIAIIVGVRARGRGRVGAFLVAGTLVVAVVLYWILYAIGQVGIASAGDLSTAGVWSLVVAVLEIGRGLIVAAALIVGSLWARRWAAQNPTA